ncbi:MAG: hypothetical protein C5B49_12445 [Bdellovibrio sp.]|nr:MAG: hypothetical protein C5B49_12445 [Bdellovibrio sp.]
MSIKNLKATVIVLIALLASMVFAKEKNGIPHNFPPHKGKVKVITGSSQPATGQYTHGDVGPLLNYGQGGLSGMQTQAIFWGSQWQNSSFAGDVITGMATFFQGLPNSIWSSHLIGVRWTPLSRPNLARYKMHHFVIEPG